MSNIGKMILEQAFSDIALEDEDVLPFGKQLTPEERERFDVRYRERETVRLRNEYQKALVGIATKLYPNVLGVPNEDYTDTVMKRAKELLDKSLAISFEEFPKE
jgi:hypothetical protein